MIELIIAVVAGGVVLSAPILLAATGEIYNERAGVINLGIEAIMALGAFVALYVTFLTGSYLTGTIAAILAGGAIAMIHGFSSITIGINQLISGLLLLTLADGLANFSYSIVSQTGVPIVTPLQDVYIPFLSDIPVLGPILFQHDAFVYLAYFLAIVFGLILYKTTWGLKIRGVGENPEACDAAGINVNRVRHICVTFGGFMAGLAGAAITIGFIGIYDQGIAAGRGWIAIIVVIFSRWSPFRAIVGSLIFGIGYSLAANLIGVGAGVSYYFLLTMPYLVALIVIVLLVRKTKGPAGLTVPYRRK